MPLPGLFLITLTACTTLQTHELDRWSSDADHGCTAVRYAFSVDQPDLADIVGPNAVPAVNEDGRGGLHLLIQSCGRPAGGETAARVTVELDETQMPLLLAGSSSSSAYVLHISAIHTDSRALLSRSGIAVLNADVQLSEDHHEQGTTTEARLTFAAGETLLRANFDCENENFSRRELLIGTGDDFAVLAGTESGLGCESPSFTFINKGLTPFSDLQLVGSAVELVTDYRWDYTVWRNAMTR